MKIIPLPLETTAITGFTHKISITYTDLLTKTSGTAFQIFPADSGTVPAGTMVTRAAFNLITPFDGGGTTTMAIEVGDDGSVGRFIPSTVVHLDGTEILYWVTSNATDTLPYAYVAANGIDAEFTAAGAALSVLDAGEIEIYLGIYDLNALEKVDQP